MPDQILVIGSSNTDMVVKTDRLPTPGETVLGGTFLMNPGGKGANQAVAAARLGGRVTFVANVGNDIFGQQAVASFQREGIDITYVRIDAGQPSGVALINVDAADENSITVAPGANAHLHPADTETALQTAHPGTLVMLQLEIPLATVEYVVRRAAERSLRVILNPAPAQSLSPGLFPHLFLITPNETETELLTGIPVSDPASAEQAARKLHAMAVANVVITLGAKGPGCIRPNARSSSPPAWVDSTAAGDCFNGTLAEQQSVADAVTFACRAASVSVTRLGAQASMPVRAQVG